MDLEQDYFTDMFTDAFGEGAEVTLLEMRELIYERENEYYFIWALEEACYGDTVDVDGFLDGLRTVRTRYGFSEEELEEIVSAYQKSRAEIS